MYKNSIRMILMPIIVALAIVAGMFINSLFIRKDIHNKGGIILSLLHN